MIKNFRIFESQMDKKYWLIPTDDRFNDVMKIVGAPTEYIFRLRNGLAQEKSQEFKKNRNCDYIYLCAGATNNEPAGWGWTNYREKVPCDFFRENGYTFEGGLGINKSDGDVYDKLQQYELETNAKKYNL